VKQISIKPANRNKALHRLRKGGTIIANTAGIAHQSDVWCVPNDAEAAAVVDTVIKRSGPVAFPVLNDWGLTPQLAPIGMPLQETVIGAVKGAGAGGLAADNTNKW
jgi:hypothetical protein